MRFRKLPASVRRDACLKLSAESWMGGMRASGQAYGKVSQLLRFGPADLARITTARGMVLRLLWAGGIL